MNHLDPKLRHSPWTFAENAALKVGRSYIEDLTSQAAILAAAASSSFWGWSYCGFHLAVPLTVPLSFLVVLFCDGGGGMYPFRYTAWCTYS